MNTPKKLLKLRLQLRTATGDAGTAHGVNDVMIGYGATRISHRVLAAGVEEELVQHPKEDVCVQMVLAEDVNHAEEKRAPDRRQSGRKF